MKRKQPKLTDFLYAEYMFQIEISLFSVPRYVRVNTLVCSIEEAIKLLVEEGWVKVTLKKKSDYAAFLERVKNLDESEFLVDYHLEFLLVFPPKTQFHNHYLLENGSLFLQDKVSPLKCSILPYIRFI